MFVNKGEAVITVNRRNWSRGVSEIDFPHLKPCRLLHSNPVWEALLDFQLEKKDQASQINQQVIFQEDLSDKDLTHTIASTTTTASYSHSNGSGLKNKHMF